MTIFVPRVYPVNESLEPRRYWEVYITENAGDSSQVGLMAVEFAETPGGADVSGTGTPYSVGGSGVVVTHEATKAFDGDSGTFWLQNGTVTARIGIDYGVNPANWKNIQDARITPWDASWYLSEDIGFDGAYCARSFELRYSDDFVTWTTQAAKDIGYSQVIGKARSVLETDPTDGTYRCHRLFVTNNNGGVYVGANEMTIEYLGTDLLPVGVQNSTLGKAVFSADNSSSFRANLAWDNDINTIWITGLSHVSNQYIGFCFPDPVAVDKITMTCQLPNMNRTPNQVIRQGSHNGIDWVDITSATWGTWTLGETKTIL